MVSIVAVPCMRLCSTEPSRMTCSCTLAWASCGCSFSEDSVELKPQVTVGVCRFRPLVFGQNIVECCTCSGVPERFEKVFLFTFVLMPFLLSLFYFPWFLFSYSVADKPKKQQKSQEMCPKLCIRCGTSFNVSFCALSVLVHQIDSVHRFLCLRPQGLVNQLGNWWWLSCTNIISQ